MNSTVYSKNKRVALVSPVLFVAILAFSWSAAAQRTINVNTIADEYDVSPNANCSLREAIETANTTAGTPTDIGGCTMSGTTGDITINVPDGAYTLSIAGTEEDANATGDLDILVSLSIVGASMGGCIVDANDIDRVFHLHGTGNVDFANITVTGGQPENAYSGAGAGIYSETSGALTLSYVNVTDNHIQEFGGYGGGLFLDNYTSAGTTISNSLFTQNSTVGGGGGISSMDTTLIRIEDSLIDNNTADWGGGGIYVNGTPLEVIDSTVSNNNLSLVGMTHGGGVNLEYSGDVTF
jgi:CSLREA domain-containing protein